MERTYRAGQAVEDHCRQCHEDRDHTVVVVDQAAQPLRVRCDYCGSEHNFRGGPRHAPTSARHAARPAASSAAPSTVTRAAVRETAIQPLSPTPMDHTHSDLEALLRRVFREESGLTPVTPAEKWRGGEMVLRPGKPGLQEKSWPIDTFFHKVVMLRNRLRTLEQQVNASDLPADQKVKLQGYITGCYGSLTSFNALFADEEDRFVGSSQD